MSIFRNGHMKLPRALFKNKTMVFVAVLGNASVKLREAARDTSEEWLGSLGKDFQEAQHPQRPLKQPGIVTNSSTWEAACLSAK